MTTQRWEVRFCVLCSWSYDVALPSKRKVCDECIKAHQREHLRAYRARAAVGA